MAICLRCIIIAAAGLTGDSGRRPFNGGVNCKKFFKRIFDYAPPDVICAILNESRTVDD